jgi:hypothetical protein
MFASNAGDQETQTRKTVSEWLQATTETWDEIVALLTGGKDAVCGFRGSAEALQAFLAEAGLEEDAALALTRETLVARYAAPVLDHTHWASSLEFAAIPALSAPGLHSR